MKKLLAVDLDGTLFYPQKPISVMTRANKKFLKDFIKAGNEVVLATGRNTRMLNKIEKKVGSKLTLIGCNGGFVMKNHEIYKSNPLDKEMCSSLFVEFKDKFGIMAWTLMDDTDKDYIYFNESVTKLIGPLVKIHYFFKFAYREVTILDRKAFLQKLNEGPIYKIMAMFGVGKKAVNKALEATNPFKERCGELCNAANSSTVIEITAKNASKGEALYEYAMENGYDINDVYCVGDTENDVSMFKRFPHSFVMSHSPIWIKEHAAHEVNRVSDIQKYVDDDKLCEDDINFYNEHKDDPIKPR